MVSGWGNYHCNGFDWLYIGWSLVILVIRTFTVCYWWMNDHRPIPFNYQSVEWMGQELICWIFWQIKLCPFVPMTMLCMVIVGLTIFFLHIGQTWTYLLCPVLEINKKFWENIADFSNKTILYKWSFSDSTYSKFIFMR